MNSFGIMADMFSEMSSELTLFGKFILLPILVLVSPIVLLILLCTKKECR